jgi:hypothetical protein
MSIFYSFFDTFDEYVDEIDLIMRRRRPNGRI